MARATFMIATQAFGHLIRKKYVSGSLEKLGLTSSKAGRVFSKWKKSIEEGGRGNLAAGKVSPPVCYS
jgi:hypothetical protein